MNNYYIQIDLLIDAKIIYETLSRIGMLFRSNVYQTCHIVKKNNIYYLVHFKELFSLFSFMNESKIDVLKIKMTDEDFKRRNYIINLLFQWKMINIKDLKTKKYIEDNNERNHLKIIKFEDKKKYNLISKFNFKF